MTDWWRSGVIYQIYPRSFADTNGDGIGDLAGIVEHVEHLGGPKGLGVDAIWLSPIYPSPWLDGGYDVSDHAAIDPLLGTMADFERLVAEAHRGGVRVLLDLVLNHTSDRHAWFVDSRSSRDSDHANWYIWRDPAGLDGRGRPRPPNNWVSFFGGSAWQWVPAREQFYLHTFLAEQPDLNWREPAVRQAQWSMVRGWLDLGVDGFRLDVFNVLLKSTSLASNPPANRLARRAWDRQRHLNDKDQADLAELLDEFRSILDERPGRTSVGELFMGDVGRAASLTRDRHLVFDFDLLSAPWSAAAFRREIAKREAAFGDAWPTIVLSNHDNSRHVSRYLRSLGRRDAATQDRLAKAAAAVLLTLRGTPFLYYGEELGLSDVPVPRAEVVDPPARRSSWTFPWWNRDRCRSPMPWTGEPGGGFSTGRPWLPLVPDWLTRNVATQALDPRSVLATYRDLLALRRERPALNSGTLRLGSAAERDVLSYSREAEGRRVAVAVNFAVGSRRAELPVGQWRVAWSSATGGSAVEASRASPVTSRVTLLGLEAMILDEVR